MILQALFVFVGTYPFWVSIKGCVKEVGVCTNINIVNFGYGGQGGN